MLDADHERHLRDARLIAWLLQFLPSAVGAGIGMAFGDKGKGAKAYSRNITRALRKYSRPVRRG